LKPLAASFIVMPCGSMPLTFAESCGLDWIFEAIGDTVVVVPPVVDPLVLPLVVPLVLPLVDPLVVPLVLPLVVPVLVPLVVVAVRLPDLCDEPVVFVDAVLPEVVVFPPWLVECDECELSTCDACVVVA
jgi:hypothetical protein